jgi:hypothetical protein
MRLRLLYQTLFVLLAATCVGANAQTPEWRELQRHRLVKFNWGQRDHLWSVNRDGGVTDYLPFQQRSLRAAFAISH